jgi:hypothetical protein
LYCTRGMVPVCVRVIGRAAAGGSVGTEVGGEAADGTVVAVDEVGAAGRRV